MRVAVFEILHREEIPVAVSIDEAVSITRRYCGTEAPGFVNGVLSAVARGSGPRRRRRHERAPRASRSCAAPPRRLEAIAAELADAATGDAAAVELAQEAARIAAEAGATAADAARAAAERAESS